jgi:hypothetical protein
MKEATDLTTRKEEMLERRQELPRIAPMVDIFENDDEILLHADMPGVTKDNITVNVDNERLEISATHRLQPKDSSNWQEFGDVEYRSFWSKREIISPRFPAYFCTKSSQDTKNQSIPYYCRVKNPARPLETL